MYCLHEFYKSLVLVGCAISISIEAISFYKYSFLQEGKSSMSHDFPYHFQFVSAVKENIVRGDLSIPFFYYMLTNIVPVIVGVVLVTYVEPVAAGSGNF